MSPLRPTAPIAADALLPGDPARALKLAQELIEAPKMSNHAHGLWGYGGATVSGNPLTIQSLGIGGPSAALVLAELAANGTRRAVQLGTCRAIAPALALGDVVLLREVVAADGTSRELVNGGSGPGQAPILGPDPELGAALGAVCAEAGVRSVRTASVDLLAPLDGRPTEDWQRRDVAALEMVSAALLAAGDRCEVAVAALLTVSEAGGATISGEALGPVLLRMGRLALAAFSGSGRG